MNYVDCSRLKGSLQALCLVHVLWQQMELGIPHTADVACALPRPEARTGDFGPVAIGRRDETERRAAIWPRTGTERAAAGLPPKQLFRRGRLLPRFCTCFALGGFARGNCSGGCNGSRFLLRARGPATCMLPASRPFHSCPGTLTPACRCVAAALQRRLKQQQQQHLQQQQPQQQKAQRRQQRRLQLLLLFTLLYARLPPLGHSSLASAGRSVGRAARVSPSSLPRRPAPPTP